MPSTRRVDSELQSGNETQYLFSDCDVRQSDADNVYLTMAGEFIISRLIRFL